MTNPPRFDGILFDMDGTLIDTVPFIVESFQHTFDRHHIKGVSEAHIKAGIGTPLELYLKQFSQAETRDLVETYTRYNELWMQQAIAIFLGVPDMLEKLKALGIKIGVVTAKRRVSAMLTLGVFEMQDCFDVIVTKEDTRNHKPHPEPILLGMQQLGLTDPARILYVGDSIHDIKSAHAAGCAACAVGWTRMPYADLQAEQPQFWANTAQSIVDFATGGILA